MIQNIRRSYKTDISSLSEVKRDLSHFLDENNISIREIRQDIKLTVVELVTNIIKHTDESEDFEIESDFKENTINLRLKYKDSQFRVPVDRFDSNKLAYNGFGMYLIKKLSDCIEYHYDEKNGEVTVNVTKRTDT